MMARGLVWAAPPHGPGLVATADLCRQFAIGAGLAIGDAPKLLPDLELERRALDRQGQVEVVQGTVQIGEQLPAGFSKQRVGCNLSLKGKGACANGFSGKGEAAEANLIDHQGEESKGCGERGKNKHGGTTLIMK